jgi:hypothetical protein
MRRRHRLNVVACCTVLAVVSPLVGLGVTLGAANSGAFTRSENLTRKGDRLPVVLPPRNLHLLIGLNYHHQLPDGCEPLASPLVQTLASRIAGRCLS